MNTPVLQVAAKAVIVNGENKVLIVRESKREENSQGGLYGLPGGRLEPGEHFFDALKREIEEEVGLEIEPGRPVYVGEWRPVIKGVPCQIVAIFMLCKAKTADVRLSEEHDAFEWIDPSELSKYSFMDPDDLVLAEYVAILNS